MTVGVGVGTAAGEEDRCLGVSKIKIYGTPLHSVMDSGSFPNLASSKVVKELGVKPEESNRVVTVANGSRAGILTKLNDVTVDIGGAILKMYFVVIGRPTISRLGSVLDFQNSRVLFAVGSKMTILAIIWNQECPKDRADDTPSESFISSSSEEEIEASSTEDGEVDEEGLALMIGKEVDSGEELLGSGSEAEMDPNLSHLPRIIRRMLKQMLRKSGLVSECLYDLRAADVPIRHHVELKKNAPVYSKGIRQSPKHNSII